MTRARLKRAAGLRLDLSLAIVSYSAFDKVNTHSGLRIDW